MRLFFSYVRLVCGQASCRICTTWQEVEVECCPEKVPNALLDENVDVSLIH